jgi:two-component system, OmpR family, sensor kinase
MTWSIRRRLLTWLVSGVMLTGVIATVVVYFKTQEEMDEVYDQHLKQIALSLRDQEDLSVSQPAISNDGGEDNEGIVVSAWDRAGEPVFGLANGRPSPAAGRPGYSTVIWNNQPWRIYVANGSGGTVEVAQPLAARTLIVMWIVLRILLPTIPLVLVLIALVWLGVRQGLKPLAEVTEALATRTGTTLQPVAVKTNAQELMPFMAAVNDLLDRLEREITKQKNFVADAAHEIRTPLAALQIQLELVQSADDAAERNAALAQLRSGIERLTHLSQQLLAMARLDPGSTWRPAQKVDLSEVAIDVMGELWPLASAKDIDLGSIAHERTLVEGDPDALRMMVTNILDNAIRYTPQGGKVDINLHRHPETVELEVIDTGSGIPSEDRDRVFDRFYRSVGNGTNGSGLGLAIVKRIAEQCGATITLDKGKDGQGLRFCVFLKPATT